MRPPVRLLMTADAVGGVWTYALDLAAVLALRGYETTLAVLGPSPSPEQLRDARAVPGLSVVDTGLPLDWTATEPAAVEEAGAAIRRLARRTRADLVHLNSPTLAAGGGFDAPVVGACHSCLATWWATVRSGPMPEDFRWRTHLLWLGLIACDALIAPTAAFAEATGRAYDLPAPGVVHNGRAPETGAAGDRAPVVVTTGRLWDDGKNAGVLDAAAGFARAAVYAAGPLVGPNGATFRPVHGLRPLGQLAAHQVRAWLRRSAIYASSALYEPFGLGVLEAAQAGCALVLSDIPTFRELWSDAAILVDPEDPKAFAGAFDRLTSQPDEAARLGRLAQARAQAFSVEAMGDGIAAVYAPLLAARPMPSREAAA